MNDCDRCRNFEPRIVFPDNGAVILGVKVDEVWHEVVVSQVLDKDWIEGVARSFNGNSGGDIALLTKDGHARVWLKLKVRADPEDGDSE